MRFPKQTPPLKANTKLGIPLPPGKEVSLPARSKRDKARPRKESLAMETIQIKSYSV